MATTFTITIETTTGGDSSYFFPGDGPHDRLGVNAVSDGTAGLITYRRAPNDVPEADSWNVSFVGTSIQTSGNGQDINGAITSAEVRGPDGLYASLSIDFDPNIPINYAPLSTGYGLTADTLLNDTSPFSPVALRLYGNLGDDRLTGSGRGDLLDGRIGSDTMTGRGGNDLYFVDDPSDRVVEIAGEGTDTVNATITYALGAALENLTLLGSADINGGGTAGANVLTGNAGRNVLAGGAGNDIYYIQTIGDRVAESANAGTDLVVSSVTYVASANIENITLDGVAAIDATGNALANTIIGNGGVNTLSGAAGDDV